MGWETSSVCDAKLPEISNLVANLAPSSKARKERPVCSVLATSSNVLVTSRYMHPLKQISGLNASKRLRPQRQRPHEDLRQFRRLSPLALKEGADLVTTGQKQRATQSWQLDMPVFDTSTTSSNPHLLTLIYIEIHWVNNPFHRF